MAISNPWRQGSLLKNPYYRTAFRMARVPREIVRYRTLVQMITQTKNVVGRDPLAHTIKSEPVSETDVNAAEQILLNPAARMAEELLHHATETTPFDPLRACLRTAAALLQPDNQAPAWVNYRWLELWAGGIIEDGLAQLPVPPVSLGARELALIPPFGNREGAENG